MLALMRAGGSAPYGGWVRNHKPAGNPKVDRTTTTFAALAILVAVFTLLAGLGVTAPAARADTVPVSASVVTVNENEGTDPANGYHMCGTDIFLQFSPVAGVDAYNGKVDDTYYGQRTFGPGGYYDSTGYETKAPAPAGTHRWLLTGGGSYGPGPCDFPYADPGRFSNPVVTYERTGQTTTTATATPSSSTQGEAVSYGASVTGSASSGTPTGTVSFTTGSTTLCKATLSAGTATCSATNTPVGSNTVKATYSGDGLFAGSSGTTSETVVPAKSSISVSVHPSVPYGGLGVGDTLDVPVTVTAGPNDLHDVTVEPLTSSSDSVTVGPDPPGTSGFTLAAGESRTFHWQVKAAKPGSATLASSAVGTDDQNAVVSGQDYATFRVSSRAIQITMNTDPSQLTLKVDDNGKVFPQSVHVTVKVTNTTSVSVDDISVVSLNPVPADPTQPLDQLAFQKKDLPISVGSLAGGETSKPITLPLTVTGDGKYTIKALALFNDPSDPNGTGRSVGQGGNFTVAVPLLFFKGSADGASADGLAHVKGGHRWYVSGHVANLSSFQTICLSPLAPQWEGNSGGLGPRQVGVVPLDQPTPPLAGPVEPGHSISFLLPAETSASGSAQGGVTLKPRVTLGTPGDDCNVKVTDGAAPVDASKIFIARPGDHFAARVDVSQAPPASFGAASLEFFGGYAESSAKLVSEEYQSGLATVKEYGTVHSLLAHLRRIDPGHAVQRVKIALASVARADAAASNFWYHSTLLEKKAFLDQVSADFTARTGKVFMGTAAAVQDSARGWFESVVSAYFAGDYNAMFKSLGRTSGTVLGRAAIETAKFEFGLTLAKKAVTLTRIAARAKAAAGAIKSVRGVIAGRIVRTAEAEGAWGHTGEELAKIGSIAEEENVLVGIRGRAPGSVKKLKGGALWKHENIKPKNVNEIDTKFLGFNHADKDLVAFRTYSPKYRAEILAKIEASGLDAEQKALVLARAETRFGEHQYLSSLEHFNKAGKIDVGFNYRPNGIKIDPTAEIRAFALDSEKLGDTGFYYRPLQENPKLRRFAKLGRIPEWCKRQLATVVCRITGDMDGVYVTNVGGTSLTEAKRVRVYQKLAAAVGWQHADTVTWAKDSGEFLFGATSKILAGLEQGGEAMLEIAPDRKTRATYLDLKKSFLFSQDSYYLDVVGGYSSLK